MRLPATTLLLLLLFALQTIVYGQGKFEFSDLSKLHTLTDPQLSPDGKSVAILVSRPDTLANLNLLSIYTIDVESGAAHQLTSEKPFLGFQRWSPSGDAIAYLTLDGERRPQIFVLSLKGGEPRKITASPTGVQQFAWSPDGKSFAFTQEDEVPQKKEMERGYDAFEVGTHSMFVKAKGVPAHLWLISAKGGPAKRLTSGSWTIPSTLLAPPSLSWHPDGTRLIFQVNETPDPGELVYTARILELSSGTITRVSSHDLPADGLHREWQPLFSPDGKQVAYQRNLENVGYGSDVYLGSPAGGTLKNLTSGLDRCFFRAEWSADSKSVFVAANDQNTVGLWMQPLEGKAKKIKLDGLCIAGSYWYQYSIGKNNSIALIASSPQSPQELYYLATPESTPRKLTNFHESLQSTTFGKQETITWKSDEFTPNGILTFPPDFDPAKKYPLVLEIHGGPRSASKESFSPSAQWKAAHGYIVLQPNYRGSDNMGYGFSEAINGDAGEGPGRDVMRGLAELKKRAYIDSTAIGVTGWSYGGFMTTWLIGNYQGWKCAVAGAAVTDWLAQYSQSDIGNMYRFEYGKGKSPFTNPEVMENWIKNSPVTYAGNVKTPTLILSNTGDERVPIAESYTYYKILQDNGVESKFIAFPIGGHIPADPIRFKEMNRHIISWLDTYMKD